MRARQRTVGEFRDVAEKSLVKNLNCSALLVLAFGEAGPGMIWASLESEEF
jgi:hypothetical protein